MELFSVFVPVWTLVGLLRVYITNKVRLGQEMEWV